MATNYSSDSEDSLHSSCYSASDSCSEFDAFYKGYSERSCKKKVPNYVSLPQLRDEYNEDMPMNKKVLLFLYAAQEEDIAFMQRLVNIGVDVDCVGQDGWTALMKACLNGKPNVVEFLLNHGSNPRFQADLFTPTMACCTFNSARQEQKRMCLDLLIQHNADVNARDKHKSTALMHAASSGYLYIVNKLLSVDGIDIHALDFDGWNAVFHAVSNNRCRVVKRLIEQGLDFRLVDHYGRRPLTLAEERCFKNLTTLLLEYEDNADLIDFETNESNFYSNHMKELPNKDGDGGFESETNKVITLYSLTKDNKGKRIGFSEFLNMGERDLYRAGVKVGIYRRYILKNLIHRFHISPWAKSSMVAITRGVPLGLEEAICMLGSMVKHLVLVKASLLYIQKRVKQRRKKIEVSFQREAVVAIVTCYALNQNLQRRLGNILQLRQYVRSIEMDDAILPQKKSKLALTFKYGLIVLGATTAGYFVFQYISR